MPKVNPTNPHNLTAEEIEAAAAAMHDAMLSHLDSPVPFARIPADNRRQAMMVAEAGLIAFLTKRTPPQ